MLYTTDIIENRQVVVTLSDLVGEDVCRVLVEFGTSQRGSSWSYREVEGRILLS